VVSKEGQVESGLEQRRRRVLSAAAERLGSVAFDWRKGLTFDLLEQATGINRKTISQDFGNKEGLVGALVDYCLNPDNFGDFGEPWAEDLVTETISTLYDTDIDLYDSVRATGDMDFAYVRNDRRLRSQLAIWGLALDDPAANAAIRRMYAFYDDQHIQVWRGLVTDLAQAGVVSRHGLTEAEVVTALTALVEGLAIRWHVDPARVPDDLFGRVFAAITAAVFEVSDPEDSGSIADLLAQIDSARRTAPPIDPSL